LFIRILERGFVVALLFYLMGVANLLFYSDLDTDAAMALQGSLHWQITLIQSGLALSAACLIATRWRRFARAALLAWPLLLLAAIQVLSIAWSIDPAISARKVLFEIVMLSIGIYLGERYTTHTLAKLLANTLCLGMAVIAVLYLAAPRYVMDSGEQGALKGLSQNKNGFGFYIGLTVALLLLVRFRCHNWPRYLCLPMAFGMLLLSRSMTSIASAAIILLTLPVWLIARLPSKQRLVGYVSVAVALSVFGCLSAVYPEQLLTLMGKNTTLTGRTRVWSQLLIAIRHHPILGYGYGAFWTGLRGESLDVLVAAGWIVPSAHNAYLDLYLALGVPGAAAAIVVLWDALRKAIEYIRAEPGWPGLWPIACLMFILIHGLGESEFIYDSSFACCIFTAVYTSLALRSARRRRSPVLVRLSSQGTLTAGLVPS